MVLHIFVDDRTIFTHIINTINSCSECHLKSKQYNITQQQCLNNNLNKFKICTCVCMWERERQTDRDRTKITS